MGSGGAITQERCQYHLLTEVVLTSRFKTLIMSQVVTNAPAWTIPGFLEARENNHLFISGADATALSYKYGTPLFVFSEPRIRANIARLQAAARKVDRPIKFCYASKANSNMAVLGGVRDAGIDIEVNSGGELYKALRV